MPIINFAIPIPEPANASPYQTSCFKPFKENFLNFVSKIRHLDNIIVPDPTTPLKKFNHEHKCFRDKPFSIGQNWSKIPQTITIIAIKNKPEFGKHVKNNSKGRAIKKLEKQDLKLSEQNKQNETYNYLVYP